MTWKKELGAQIRGARERAKKTQEELSAELASRYGCPYTHSQISHIENGKSAPAVNIVTAIAEILNAEFELGGCKIGRKSDRSVGQLTVMPQQLSFPFDVEHSFSGATLKLIALPEDAISLHAVFSRGQRGPIKTIDVHGIKKASA